MIADRGRRAPTRAEMDDVPKSLVRDMTRHVFEVHDIHTADRLGRQDARDPIQPVLRFELDTSGWHTYCELCKA